MKKLQSHLSDDDGAPLWRMVYAKTYQPSSISNAILTDTISFLESRSSRSALGCSREQLSLLLTYYQVMPSFLDLVLTFEQRRRPLNRTMFRREDYLAENSQPFALPELGRSGMVMQHAFNLLSMEHDEKHGAAGKWLPRQAAMYHSFDVQNGRSLWIVLKGNALIAKRFLASTGSHRQLKANSITSPETSLVAALHIHLMVVDWCVEDWADYLDHLETSLEDMSADARLAHVDEATEVREMTQTYESRRTSTMRSEAAPSRQSTFERPTSQPPTSPTTSEPHSPTTPRKRSLTRSFSDLIPAMRRLSTLRSHRTKGSWSGDIESGPIAEHQGGGNGETDDEDQSNNGGELAELGRDFSFKRFQRLNNLGDDVEQARVAIEQNKGVLKELRLHYKDAFDSYGFQTYIKVDKCRDEIVAFDRRVESIERELDIHYGRLNSLARALDNEKVMVSACCIRHPGSNASI